MYVFLMTSGQQTPLPQGAMLRSNQVLLGHCLKPFQVTAVNPPTLPPWDTRILFGLAELITLSLTVAIVNACFP